MPYLAEEETQIYCSALIKTMFHDLRDKKTTIDSCTAELPIAEHYVFTFEQFLGGQRSVAVNY
jgi:hypothetical protein